MNIILDNIIYWLQRSGGGSVYWTELSKRFNKLDNVAFYDQAEPTNNIFRQNLELKNIHLETKYSIKLRRYLPFTEKINEKSIFHSSYFRISNSKNAINVTTIHDFTTEKFRTGLARFINLEQKRFAVKKAKGVICISENTKRDLLSFFPDTDPNKIKVIYNGVSDDFYYIENDFLIEEADPRFSSLKNEKYILYIGHRTRYKNFDLVVKAANRFKAEYTLVVVGEAFTKKEKSMINSYFKENEIVLFSGLKNRELNYLYNKAFVLVYPSSYEGFGIPIVEAMKTNCAVIAANNSSIPEIAGDAAHLITNIDEDSIVAAISKLKNREYRKNLISQGLKQSLKFNWDTTFQAYLDYYKELYND